jgi:soluble lytic murein transglycosylase
MDGTNPRVRPLFVLALAVLSCREPSTTGSPPVASTSQFKEAGSAPAFPPKASEGSVAGARPWRQLVVEERWDAAARAIDGLFGDEPSDPEVRYVRGRIARRLEDCERAIRLFEGLESELPALATDVREERIACHLEAGDPLEALEYYAGRADPESQLNAALAEERASKREEAFARVDRVITRLAHQKRRSRSEEALLVRARAHRGRLAEVLERRLALVSDLRWLSIEAPTARESEGADAKLEALGEGLRLTTAERYDRGLALARDGQLERALREAELMAAAPGKALTPGQVAHVRGLAYYHARRYEEAVVELTRASKLDLRYRVEDSFLAARALSRSHDDAGAIERYRAFIAAHPKSGYVEEARYVIARLEYVLGNFEAAERDYGAYLARYKARARFAGAARTDRAITLLALGRHPAAKVALAGVIRDEHSPRARALYEELRAVALLGTGEREAAVNAFRKVIEEHPLSFAALASSSRLASLGESTPPLNAESDGDAPRPALELELPPRAALLSRLGFDGDAEDDVFAHARAIVTRHSPRGNEALCEVYGLLSTATRRYRHAQSAIRASAVMSAPGPRNRWAWECMYPRPFAELVQSVESEYELPPGLVHAVMRQESAFQHAVISPAGAQGLMQLILPTARRVAEELGKPFDERHLASPGPNVTMGGRYLARLLGRFGGRVVLAAAAYNAGPHALTRWLEGGETLPLDVFVAKIPYGETRGYVQRVAGNLARYQLLEGGPAAVQPLDLTIPLGLRALPEDY